MNVIVKNELEPLFKTIARQSIPAVAYDWLQTKMQQIHKETSLKTLNSTFVLLPRKTGHGPLTITIVQLNAIANKIPGFAINDWTADRLCRCWLLMNIKVNEPAIYEATIENLFATAEMNEQVALYSALPLLAFPQAWLHRCTEGVRSNIGDVLDAIMYHNPYPAQNLPQPPWNQLVLKAFFTGKDITKIVGIDERANVALAETLVDYASERSSAGRAVNPQLWRLVTPFLTEAALPFFEKLLVSKLPVERYAAVLACHQSNHSAANNLLQKYPQQVSAVAEKNITWNNLHLFTSSF